MSKASKRKRQAETTTPVKLPGGMAAAIRWPLYEVLISQNWNEEGNLVTILVSRSGPNGKIAAASFLVDLCCLGVKSALVRTYTPDDYQELRYSMAKAQPMASGDFDLAAKIIYAGHAYAEELGFKPDPVFYQAQHLLTGAKPDACPIPVPLGKDGKPFFIAGPYDDAPRIIDHLMQRVGEGNFDYVIPNALPLELMDMELMDMELMDEDDEDEMLF